MIWQPIETAPKDGREVLVWNGMATIGYWDVDKHKALWRTEVSASWDRINQPTHWMPLPEAPK